MTTFLRYDGSLAQTIYTDDHPLLKQYEVELDNTQWKEGEVDMEEDIRQWNTDSAITPGIKTVCENATGEFNLFDVAVRKELTGGFTEEIKNIQLSSIYTTVSYFEVIHSRTYWKMGLSLLGRDRMRELIEPSTCPHYIMAKAKWYADNMRSELDPEEMTGSEEHIADHARRVVVNCAAEGILFQPKFSSIEWIKAKGLLPGFCYANELIRRDEGLHCRLAADYNKLLGSPVAPDIIRDALRGVSELEIQGVMETHPTGLPGLSKEALCEYVRYCANFIFRMLNPTDDLPYEVVENPFSFMDIARMTAQTNFFEKKVSQYWTRGRFSGGVNVVDDF